MNNVKYLDMVIVSILCTACASGGGSFDTPQGEGRGAGANASPNFRQLNSNEVPEVGDLTEVGYTVTAPWGKSNASISVYGHKLHAVNAGRADTDESNYDSIRFMPDGDNAVERKVAINIVPKDETYAKTAWKQSNNNISTPNYDLANFGLKGTAYNAGNYDFANNDITGDFLKQTAFQYTKVGVIALKDPTDNRTHSNIYYKGQNKTTDVPKAGNVTYDGVWEYVTHNRVSRTDYVNSGNKEYLIETSNKGYYQNTATFSADFGAKELTGNLDSKDRFGEIKYHITAKISHNGFLGTATKDTAVTTLFEGDPLNTPLDNTAAVSGSFYGPQAAELAGRMNGDTGQIVGVFSAKAGTPSTPIVTDGELYQASALVLDSSAATKTISSSDEFSKLNFSGNIKKLQIDGVVIELDKMTNDSAVNCCDAYQTLSIGKYVRTDTADPNKLTGLYLQGHLTPISKVPQSGKVDYRGSWFTYAYAGNALADKVLYTGAVDSSKKIKPMDASFIADFGAKTVEGKLFSALQTLGSDNPAVTFKADIDGNSFSTDNAKLNVSNAIDINDTNPKFVTGTAKVKGHFYGVTGPNELGGTVMKDDSSFAAVFAGKQVQ